MKRPDLHELSIALLCIAELLGADQAEYCFEGRFRFALDGEWSFVISPDSAGRFRLEVCLRSRVRATLWCHASDRRRLGRLVLAAQREVAALAAA